MVAGFDRGNGKNEIRIWSGQAKNGCAFQALFVSACSIFSSLIGHFEDVSWKFVMKNWYSNRENAHDQSQEESLEDLPCSPCRKSGATSYAFLNLGHGSFPFFVY